jgi:hypothetical protein
MLGFSMPAASAFPRRWTSHFRLSARRYDRRSAEVSGMPHTGLASMPDTPDVGRDLVGLGLRYSLGFLNSGSFRPFVAVPLQVLHSQVADHRITADLQSASLSGVPEASPLPPLGDQVRGEWGWGTGLEAGLRVVANNRVSAQSSLQVLYQDIYGSESRNGAWNWHVGLSYAFGGSEH